MPPLKHGLTSSLGLLAAILSFAIPSSMASQMSGEGWRSDVDFVVESIELIHPRPWQRVAEGDFKREARDLKGEIPGLSEEEIAVRLMQLVVSIGDGHTQLLPLNRSEFTTWFPVRLDHFCDGIFITAITTTLARWYVG